MATWQYDFYLIPRQSAVKNLGRAHGLVDREVFNATDWWSDHRLPAAYDQEFSRMLSSEGAELVSGIRTWGTPDGNRIDVLIESDRECEVLVRADLRSPDVEFLRRILALASQHGCVLLTEDLRLIEPDLQTLASQASQSPAAEFVSDPAGFLTKLS